MDMDPKMLVLLALYTEYQKPIPKLYSITFDTVGLEKDVFNVAVEKLQNEDYISGARFSKGGRHKPPRIVWLDDAILTRNGIDYAKQILVIHDENSKKSTLEKIMKKAVEWGNERLENIAAKTLAEIIKG